MISDSAIYSIAAKLVRECGLREASIYSLTRIEHAAEQQLLDQAELWRRVRVSLIDFSGIRITASNTNEGSCLQLNGDLKWQTTFEYTEKKQRRARG